MADGSERIVDFTIVPIKDEAGRVLFLAPTGIDITDRKRAEADRQKFVTLVETSTDFIGMCDLQGVPFFVNRAGLDMVGLDNLEQARRVPVADFFFPEDQARMIEEFFPSVLEQGHGETDVRFRNFKTGEARWMAYKVLTLPDADGRPLAFATVSQDVTERRRLADDLRMLAADLSEANRRKTEFLAMLAHELRNPLAPISNAVRALRIGHGDAKVARAALGMFERQVAQLARLVDDLLDLNRITRGKIALRKRPIELVPIVEQAIEAARARYGSLNHELTVTLPTEPVYLSADPTRLAQVIGNLLNNAFKFTDPGGHIGLTVTHEGAQAVVRVRDNGIGIAPETLPHLFKMFTQADTSLERARDGLGIGLTLVKALVEMHDGVVEARSDGLGRGSEFEVRLPALAEASATIAEAIADSEPATTTVGRRILIVDDNVDGADTMAMLLDEVGHETHTAHDGVEAIATAERLRPDVVLLDIGLPKLNGYEVCQRLRERPWAENATDRGDDRLGAGRGPPAIAGGRLRHPPRQTGRSRPAHEAALHPTLTRRCQRAALGVVIVAAASVELSGIPDRQPGHRRDGHVRRRRRRRSGLPPLAGRGFIRMFSRPCTRFWRRSSMSLPRSCWRWCSCSPRSKRPRWRASSSRARPRCSTGACSPGTTACRCRRCSWPGRWAPSSVTRSATWWARAGANRSSKAASAG